MSRAVLDSSAILAMLWDEPGSGLVEELLLAGDCLMSAVNVAEVAGRLADRGATGARIDEVFTELGIEIVPFDRMAAISVGLLVPPTRVAGLSLGDRAALALAGSLDVPAYTADRAWLTATTGVETRLIRPTGS